ncbi:thiamine-phosphate pyrophosphorylase [Achlya hypogyna]|uniref:Thiamine-phosphate pyrophosphorylase n=1 Tax=Achlya hypogyna TaxID=1202772 RepID=A0A1V9ZMG0_ACHHY|nr:thiamine-phosphate pyrophosphorylase [Achlya hypogyna]
MKGAFPGLRRPALVLVVSPHDVLEPLALKRALKPPSIDVVQLRNDPSMPVPSSILYKAAGRLTRMCQRAPHRPRVILNAPYDATLVSPQTSVAYAFHYPERTLTDETANELAHIASAFGVSVHSVPNARRAIELGAFYLQVGTMFPTASHPEKKVVEGPSLIREIRQQFPNTPLIGIGGIDETNVAKVLDAGANGVAVIRAILAAAQPDQVAQRLRHELDAFPRI